MLGFLAAAAEQNDQHRATLDEVQPVSGPVIDPQFGYALAYRLNIAEQPGPSPRNAFSDLLGRAMVLHAVEPLLELRSLPDLDHVYSIYYIGSTVNYKLQAVPRSGDASTGSCRE